MLNDTLIWMYNVLRYIFDITRSLSQCFDKPKYNIRCTYRSQFVYSICMIYLRQIVVTVILLRQIQSASWCHINNNKVPVDTHSFDKPGTAIYCKASMWKTENHCVVTRPSFDKYTLLRQTGVCFGKSRSNSTHNRHTTICWRWRIGSFASAWWRWCSDNGVHENVSNDCIDSQKIFMNIWNTHIIWMYQMSNI